MKTQHIPRKTKVAIMFVAWIALSLAIIIAFAGIFYSRSHAFLWKTRYFWIAIFLIVGATATGYVQYRLWREKSLKKIFRQIKNMS